MPGGRGAMAQRDAGRDGGCFHRAVSPSYGTGGGPPHGVHPYGGQASARTWGIKRLTDNSERGTGIRWGVRRG